jgi:hypothetical protein
MKKILLLFLSVLTFISCTDTYRSDDFFIVVSKEMGNTEYKYLYGVNHYMTSTNDGTFYLDYHFFETNENYELGDTIKFTRYTSN